MASRLFLVILLCLAAPVFALVETSELIGGYVGIHQTLSHDDFTGTQSSAIRFIPFLKQWVNEQASGELQLPHVKRMLLGTENLSLSPEEAAQRKAYAELAEGFVEFLRQDKENQAAYQLYFCPMAEGYAYWVQKKGEPMTNPYFGIKMLSCGVKRPW